MTDIQLGEFTQETNLRDAVHVAIVSVLANEKLAPGQDVGLIDSDELIVGVTSQPVGIIDPFLKSLVFPGQCCWLFLYPNAVTGMRHHWKHPAFDFSHLKKEEEPKPTKEESEAWLREFARVSDCPDYDTLISAASGGRIEEADPVYGGSYRLDEEYLHFCGRDAHGEIPPEFWEHVENVTGLPCFYKPPSFSCSC